MGELREAVSKMIKEPVDNTEAFFCHHDITDDEEEDAVRFVVTTKKMKSRISSELVQDDATYRLTWQGFPVFVSGRSTRHMTVSSHHRCYIQCTVAGG